MVDKRSSFETYKKILEYFSLPVTLYQNENIINQDDIYCFNSILKAINGYYNNIYDNEFKHAFYSLAKSYLFSYSDNQILQCIVTNDYKNNTIYNSLKSIVDELDKFSISDLFNQIIKDLNWYNKLIYKGEAKSSEARLAYLTNLAKSLDDLGYDLNDVIAYFKELNDKELEIVIPNKNSDNDAIKIMTIHNSKGLEFPICYFLGFDNTFNIDETKDNFILNKNGLILPFIKNNTKYHNIEWFDYKNDYVKDEISEKIRLFYVALTRAKEKMIIPIDLNNKEKKNIEDVRCFSDFLVNIKDDLYKYTYHINKESLHINTNYKMYTKTHKLENNIKPFNYIKIENNKSVIETEHFSKKSDVTLDNNLLEIGTNLHNILFQLDFKNPDMQSLDNNTTYIINRFLNTPFLELEKSINIYKEFEFIDNNKKGIIDLIIEYPNEYKIIDYKLSNIEDEEYILQLHGYKEYLSKIVNKPIKLYLYSLLKGNYKIIE